MQYQTVECRRTLLPCRACRCHRIATLLPIFGYRSVTATPRYPLTLALFDRQTIDRRYSMTQDLIIDATGLTKTYRSGAHEVAALRAVDFAVSPGEMVA